LGSSRSKLTTQYAPQSKNLGLKQEQTHWFALACDDKNAPSPEFPPKEAKSPPIRVLLLAGMKQAGFSPA
jgi:hypothetical protein